MEEEKEYKLKLNQYLSDERYYIFVSNFGDVFSFKFKKTKNIWVFKRLKTETDQGYKKIRIKDKYYMVSRLVAETWLELPEDYFCGGYEVHHIDENKLNNRASNLLIIPKDLHKTLHSHKVTKKFNGHLKSILNKRITDIFDEEYLFKILIDAKNAHNKESNFCTAFHASNNKKKLYFKNGRDVYEIEF